ncbi:MAG: hypothetical protein WKF34_07405 [Pyrinomonadaceae bacterium]
MSLLQPTPSSKLRTAFCGLFVACLLFLGIGLAGSAASSRPSAVGAEPKPETPSATQLPVQASAIQQPEQPTRVIRTAELILITPRGFEPNTIRRPRGPVLLAMVNRSELPLMTLRLERVNGTMLRTVEMPRNRRRLSIPITLEAGRYRIVDLLRPTRSLNIEITE